MSSIFISIVIPTHNSEEFIERTLNSVFDQTYTDYEVIISDDGSTDGTLEIVKDVFDKHAGKKTVILNGNHEGPGAARNKGINASNGKWVSFLDSDDEWMPEKLSRVACCIQDNDKISLVCHSEIWKNGENEILLNYQEMFDNSVEPFLSLYRKNTLSTSAVTVKKELLLKAGLFDVALPAAQDYDLWLRLSLLEDFRVGFIETPLGRYITRAGNISSRPERRLDCMLQIAGKYYKGLERATNFPGIEWRKFEGRAYGSAAMDLLAARNLKKGFLFMCLSLAKWPFRLDWIRKLLRR